jgi:hypothetical protein
LRRSVVLEGLNAVLGPSGKVGCSATRVSIPTLTRVGTEKFAVGSMAAGAGDGAESLDRVLHVMPLHGLFEGPRSLWALAAAESSTRR